MLGADTLCGETGRSQHTVVVFEELGTILEPWIQFTLLHSQFSSLVCMETTHFAVMILVRDDEFLAAFEVSSFPGIGLLDPTVVYGYMGCTKVWSPTLV